VKRYSRGQFMRQSAVAVGGVAGIAALNPASAFARESGDPRPIPGGFDSTFAPVPSDPFIHVLPPSLGFEMSSITDLSGVVGAAEIQGTARGSDGTTYGFDTDMRFMTGTYVGLDGRVRKGSFGFI
jgi:hypothetical protein